MDLMLVKNHPKYKTLNVNLPLFYYRRHLDNMTNSVRRIVDARRAIKKDVAKEKLKTLLQSTVLSHVGNT